MKFIVILDPAKEGGYTDMLNFICILVTLRTYDSWFINI
jgi:hypothetical protein